MSAPLVPTDQLWRGFRVPAAAGDPWLEALVPLQYAAYPLRDLGGRPLGELNTPAALREGVPFDVRPCPYPDARRGRPMNAGALRPVREHMGWVLDSLRVIRAAYAERHPATRDGLDLAHAWSFAATAQALPFLLVRSGAAADGSIPIEVAALFKVVQGVYMSAWADWVAPVEEPARGVPLVADAWVDRMLARERLFNHVRGRVCSGPEGAIREVVAVCVGPCPPAGPVGEAAPLVAYGGAWAALTLERWRLEPNPPHAVDRIGAHQGTLLGPAERADTSEGRITELQGELRRICGAAPPPGAFDRGWIPTIPRPRAAKG